MSTVPSGVLPLTASGPSLTLPAHPATSRTHTPTTVMRVIIRLRVRIIIRLLLLYSIARWPTLPSLGSRCEEAPAPRRLAASVLDPRRSARIPGGHRAREIRHEVVHGTSREALDARILDDRIELDERREGERQHPAIVLARILS